MGEVWNFACIFILVAFVTAEDGQRHIDILSGKEIPYKSNLPLGAHCINSGECISECCLRQMFGVPPQEPDNRILYGCAPTGLPGQRCTDGQIKGGMYVGYCPCAKGDCIDGRCPS